jgi:hypothetical protein
MLVSGGCAAPAPVTVPRTDVVATASPSLPAPTPIDASPTIGPSDLATTTLSDAIILELTDPVTRGDVAVARVTVVREADCTIRVIYDSGQSTAGGLEPKNADGAGNVSWSWTVEATAPTGMWPVEVTCGTVSGQRAVARKVLTIR